MAADRRLTAYRDRAARVRHLVVESLMLLAALPEPASPLLDIGTGPGVPGLILKLARPAWEVVLIEAAQPAGQLPPARGPAPWAWGCQRRLGARRGAGVGRAGRGLPDRDDAGGGRGRGGRGARRALPRIPRARWCCRSGRRAAASGGNRREITLAVPGGIALAAPVSYNSPDGAGRRRSTWNKTSSRVEHRSREPEGRRREDHDSR